MAIPRPGRARRWWALAFVVPAACAPPTGAGDRTEITVLAAASLTEAFTAMGRRFEGLPGRPRVVFSFAASSTLAQQVRAGAPADVVASADRAVVDGLAADGLGGPVHRFARNRLALVVATGNPRGVRSLADLARPDVDLVVCARDVPCGQLAERALGRAGVDARPRSYELNVKAVLTRVALGEADAGLVYVTDVLAAGGRVEGVALEGAGLFTDYAIATLDGGAGGNADASRFVAVVRSAEGRRALLEAGFEVP